VVIQFLKLQLGKFHARARTLNPDPPTAKALQDLMRQCARDVKDIETRLRKAVPAEGAIWSTRTWSAIKSVFSDDHVKKLIEELMRYMTLLGQYVTTSLPTADEIARAVKQQQNHQLDANIGAMIEKLRVSLTRPSPFFPPDAHKLSSDSIN